MTLKVAAIFQYFPFLIWIYLKHSAVLPKITFLSYMLLYFESIKKLCANLIFSKKYMFIFFNVININHS